MLFKPKSACSVTKIPTRTIHSFNIISNIYYSPLTLMGFAFAVVRNVKVFGVVIKTVMTPMTTEGKQRI
jgi:hypothetical protein